MDHKPPVARFYYILSCINCSFLLSSHTLLATTLRYVSNYLYPSFSSLGKSQLLIFVFIICYPLSFVDTWYHLFAYDTRALAFVSKTTLIDAILKRKDYFDANPLIVVLIIFSKTLSSFYLVVRLFSV